MHFFQRLFLSHIALLLTVCWSLPAQAANSSNGYIFKTKNESWGPVEIYICPFGVKKMIRNLNFTMVATPPKWQLIAFRDDCKQICNLTDRENALITLPPNTKITRVPTALKGLSVVKETFSFTPIEWDETESMVGMIMPTGNAEKTRMTMVGSETIRLCSTEFSAELLRAAGRILVYYPGDGLAIENRFIRQNGKRFTCYELTDWKRAKLTASDFAVPKNYKVCHSFRELKAAGINSQMEDLVKQLDFGEPLGGGASAHH